jgi:hypothetical protein
MQKHIKSAAAINRNELKTIKGGWREPYCSYYICAMPDGNQCNVWVDYNNEDPYALCASIGGEFTGAGMCGGMLILLPW